nr:MAG TPA: hypothetical protein [Caudoviricetes sp.]
MLPTGSVFDVLTNESSRRPALTLLAYAPLVPSATFIGWEWAANSATVSR